MEEPIIVVGAGLSGLYAASILHKRGIECTVLESRARIGGRVLSEAVDERPDLGKFDLGPTWFWPQHEPIITNLIQKLHLETFDQYTDGAILLEQSQNTRAHRHLLPHGAADRSVRLVGGIESLTDKLANTLPHGTVKKNTRVVEIHMNEEEALTVEASSISGDKKIYRARAVILALPPRIVAENITFTPALSQGLIERLHHKPTWMAGQGKVIAVYDHPFWSEDGLSGQAMSWAGPTQEIHDASTQTCGGALFGFFGIDAKIRQELGREKLLEMVIEQLTRLFGTSANRLITLLYKDWFQDPATAVEDDLIPLTSFPNYGPPTNAEIWKGKIVFAGTETSHHFGGHLEGALYSAERASLKVMEL